MESMESSAFKEINDVATEIGETKIAPAHGIAALALNMALKYHDINTVQDGALYQQYKLEGRNMSALHLDHVFETAIRMEMHLLGASDRIAKILVEAIVTIPVDDENVASNEHGDDRTNDSGSTPDA